MSVKTILDLKGRNVVTVDPEITLRTAARHLYENRIGVVVISDDQKSIKGILSERDIVTAIGRHGAECLDRPVSSAMVTNVYRCTEDMTVEEVMQVMNSRKIRHLPVETDGKLGGIISIGDAVKAHIARMEMEAEQIKAYIAG
ncbi:CBS domain-containing protein [Rhizobium sp. L1K21]|uniref:CBS domain-containing protein n=1 Tax=Rhizobium sp. L1K21 TaxID=2954933 RepID=UPI002092E83E|nr:CBS domain-containing protein [Rhizobium sp. L1K21]MCO6186165.1 CBS domain-containing protein [Rhizobium sp. L1K21]